MYCMKNLKIEHKTNGSELPMGICSNFYKLFIVFGYKHDVGGFYDESTDNKGVSYVIRSESKLKDLCLLNFVRIVMDLDMNDSISMIRSLQLTYVTLIRHTFRSGNVDLLCINMSIMSEKGTYLKICRKHNCYIPLNDYMVSTYECDKGYLLYRHHN